MKWFKHISDSLDDPFIQDLIEQCGSDGYLVFFGILEVYAREFKPEPNWNLQITRDYLKRKLHKRQETLILKSLEVIKNSGKWDVNINGRYITVFIPKFTEMLDNWTQRKLQSGYKVAPKILKTEVEVEVEVDKNPYSPLFEKFWKAYPNKTGKGDAFKKWQKLKCDKIVDEIIQSLENHKRSFKWKKEGGAFIPNPSTWINQRRWEDEPSGRQRADREDAGTLF